MARDYASKKYFRRTPEPEQTIPGPELTTEPEAFIIYPPTEKPGVEEDGSFDTLSGPQIATDY